MNYDEGQVMRWEPDEGKICFIVEAGEYLVLKIATSPTQAEQSFSF